MKVANDAVELLLRGSVASMLNVTKALSEERVVSISDRFISSIAYPEGREFMRTAILLIKRNLPYWSPACQRGAANFLSNLVLGPRKKADFFEKEGVTPPFLLVISPTMRCNLRCNGCYAGDYSMKDDLSFETVDRVLREAEEMGICFMTISGGEPFVWPHLLETFRSHPDIFFQVYTNGTLIDRKAARRLAELGNVLPCISVEGFREETDSRRGDGTWDKVLQAMDNLKDAGVFLGFSATATRYNNDLVVSDDFVDFYASKGCVIGWYFNYIPIGRKPDMGLMTTPEQRILRRERLLELRESRDLLLADFWNDGLLVGGCMAGGRLYLHINSDGAVEPCVFCHFAKDNIKEKTLAEVLKSDLFEAIRLRQPYSDNLLRPCMIIDHPHILRKVIEETGALPTHEGADTIINDFAGPLDKMAERYGELADEAWQVHLCATCGGKKYGDAENVPCSMGTR